MRFLSIDFETRSVVNLKTEGVYRYASHPSTGIWCMAWAFDDEPVKVWRWGEDIPQPVLKAMHDPEVIWRAWNAQFERLIFDRILRKWYHTPSIPLERWLCTAAQAARLGLPRGLEDAAAALKLPVQKDAAGYRLMLQMAKPRRIEPTGEIIWWDDHDRRMRLYDYCRQDVVVERAVGERLPPTATWKEREVWLFDQRVNDRGVLLDRPLAAQCLKLTKQATNRISRELRALTNGAVPKVTNVERLKDWLGDDQGMLVGSLAKVPMKRILAREDIEPVVRQALELRKEGGKSSTRKYQAMLNWHTVENVLHGMLLYHAASTGRWAGKGPQPQNFVKGEVPVSEELVAELMRGDLDRLELFYPSIMTALASGLRACLRSRPGHVFTAADYNAIEARMVAWLFGAEKLVKLFADGGKVYESMAETIYEIPADDVAKDSIERFVAKNTVLGCGFQMGAKTFRLQLRDKFGVDVSEELAERAVKAYRGDYWQIPDGWKGMNKAAIRVVREHITAWYPVPETDGKIHFRMHGDWLRMRLPSGRSLWYAEAKITERLAPWTKKTTDKDGNESEEPVYVDAVSYMGVHPKLKKWTRMTLYGGWLTENAVQGMARDLLVEGMFRVEAAGYPIVLTVHDEMVSEHPEGFGSVEHFIAEMTTLPEWARGCPVAAEGWRDTRYRK